MSFTDSTTSAYLELEGDSCDFLGKSRLFTKQRKTWKGRKMPEDKRKSKDQEKEQKDIVNCLSVPRLKLKKGNDLIELTETAGGVEIPKEVGEQPLAGYLFFWCPFCEIQYNDSIKHGLTCTGRDRVQADFFCEYCGVWGIRKDHFCEMPIEVRVERPWCTKSTDDYNEWDEVDDENIFTYDSEEENNF